MGEVNLEMYADFLVVIVIGGAHGLFVGRGQVECITVSVEKHCV